MEKIQIIVAGASLVTFVIGYVIGKAKGTAKVYDDMAKAAEKKEQEEAWLNCLRSFGGQNAK